MAEEALPVNRVPQIVAALCLVGVIGGVAYWFFLRDTTVPSRVMIVARGCGSDCEAVLRTRMAFHLDKALGFELRPNLDDGPVVVDTQDAALATAKDLDVGYLVEVTATVVEERPGLTPDTVFVVAEAELELISTVEETLDLPDPLPPIRFGSEGVDRADAMGKMARAWANVFYAQIAGDLLRQPRLAEYIEKGGEASSAGYVERLEDAFNQLAGRDRTSQRLREVCEEADEALASDAGPHEVRCGPVEGCGQHYLFGASADGSRYLRHVESPTWFIPFEASPTPAIAQTVERIDLVEVSGATRTIAYANNFVGWGDLSADGTRAVFVEQGSRRQGLVVVNVETGERQVLYVAEGRRYLDSPKISPDGAFIGVMERVGRRGARQLYTLRVADGLVAGPFPALAFDWLQPDEGLRLAYIQADPAVGRRLVLHDPTNAAPAQEVAGELSVRDIVGLGPTGILVTTGNAADGCGVARVVTHPEPGLVDPVDSPCLGHPVVFGEAIVGAARESSAGDPLAGDPEMVRVDASGNSEVLTANRLLERYPQGGARLFFERVFEKSPFTRTIAVSTVCSL
ncbi:MAG: hypothetical protein AAGF12_39925 [Myxococcota bacterium]